jgi:alkylation response protein AidB-like acyl-CoA dehydrogenase
MAITEETADLYTQTRDLAAAELVPLTRSSPHGRVNRSLVRALATTGLLGRLFPSTGGQATSRDICDIREALGYACPIADVMIAMQGIGGYPVLQSGQDHQRDRWLGPLSQGTAIAAFALTEPEVGSDAANLRLAATPSGDGWSLYGTKQWITNAPDADFYVTFARTTPDARAHGVTAFLVPADRPGLSGEPLDMIADHPIGKLNFDAVPVSRADVLGEVDHGFRVAMQTLDLFRPSVGAAAIGMAQVALDAALRRTAVRQACGAALRDFQAVAHSMADAATKLEASRLLVHHAADGYDSGAKDITMRSAMAKLFATESAQDVIDRAIQVHGASGLRAGHLLEGLWREIRATRIYEGASEIQRDLIARGLYRDYETAAPWKKREDRS